MNNDDVFYVLILEHARTDNNVYLYQWIRSVHIASCNCIDHLWKIQVSIYTGQFIMSRNQRKKKMHVQYNFLSHLAQWVT